MTNFKDTVKYIIAAFVTIKAGTDPNSTKAFDTLKEKIVFGKTITDYAKYVDESIMLIVNKVLPLINDPD